MGRHISGVFPPEPFHRIKIRSGAEEKLAKFRGICYNVFVKYCFAIFRGIRHCETSPRRGADRTAKSSSNIFLFRDKDAEIRLYHHKPKP